MTLLSVIKNHYREAIMSNYPIKGFIERTKGTFKRITGKLAGGKTAATRNKVSKSDATVQGSPDELKDGVKKPA
jgi:uncharacterized protein YjbJ (UPF0337 family)